jgi:hypothetical protein
MLLFAQYTESVILRFKLYLCPSGLEADGLRTADLKPLPPGKTAIEVFGDFLAYLFDCARRFIMETIPNGASLWNSVAERIDFVLSHPNGWEGSQQGKMREAAVHARLIPNTPHGHSRVHFVTEGEASLLYCIDNGLAIDAIKVPFVNTLRSSTADTNCRLTPMS